MNMSVGSSVTGPPLTAARVVGRQINVRGTDALRPYLDFHGEGEFYFAESSNSHTSYSRRRFSGAGGLPSGRYYALSSTMAKRGPDQTLALELTAYTASRLRFSQIDPYFLNVVDLADPTARAVVETPGEFTNAHGVDWFAIHVRLRKFGAENAGFRESAVIPYSHTVLTFERAFDMRRVEALDWLRDALNFDFPNIVFGSGIEQPGALRRYVDEAEMNFQDFNSVHAIEGPVAEAKRRLQTELSGYEGLTAAGAKVDGDAELFGYLLTPDNGGSPLTHAIGAALRQYGADGIIYPSAREDAAIHRSGETIEHFGFNVVDLRDVALPEAAIWFIKFPTIYGFSWRGRLQTGNTDHGREWSIEGQRLDTLSRNKKFALVNFLERSLGVIPGVYEAQMPDLLVAPDGAAATARRYEFPYHVLSDLFLGVLKASDQAWGLAWLEAFDFKIPSLGQWIGYYAGQVKLFARQSRAFDYVEGWLIDPSSGTSHCLCCAAPRATRPDGGFECSACGFSPGF